MSRLWIRNEKNPERNREIEIDTIKTIKETVHDMWFDEMVTNFGPHGANDYPMEFFVIIKSKSDSGYRYYLKVSIVQALGLISRIDEVTPCSPDLASYLAMQSFEIEYDHSSMEAMGRSWVEHMLHHMDHDMPGCYKTDHSSFGLDHFMDLPWNPEESKIATQAILNHPKWPELLAKLEKWDATIPWNRVGEEEGVNDGNDTPEADNS